MKNSQLMTISALLLGGVFASACTDPVEPASNSRAPIAFDGSVLDRGIPNGPNPTPGMCPDEMGEGIDPATISVVETRLQYQSTRAGEVNSVSCDVIDVNGELIIGMETQVAVEPEAGVERVPGGLQSSRPGDYQVRCILPCANRRDETPADWNVRPGVAAAVTTTVNPRQVSAGEEAQVGCQVSDAYGNVVESQAPEIRITPTPSRLRRLDGGRLVIENAGQYVVACVVAGVGMTGTASLTVVPGLPATLNASILPFTQFYNVGAVIEVFAQVADRYDNLIAGAATSITTNPRLPQLGERRVRLEPAGTYRLTVSVDGQTAGDIPLSQDFDLIVDAGAPTITCLEPAYGSQVVRRANGSVNIVGEVSDTAGVRDVQIDGRPVDVGADGRFSVTVPVGWGVNVHEVLATDATGAQSSTLCAFFAADEYQDPDEFAAEAFRLRLGSAALEDGGGQRPLGSVGDIVRTVLNSPGLLAFLDRSARELNPVLPVDCRLSALGFCIFSAGAIYESIDAEGPHDATLTMEPGGFRLDLELRDVTVGLELTGTLDTRGTVNAEWIRASASFDVGLNEDGTVRVDLNPGTLQASSGDLSSSFEGLVSGNIVRALFWVLETFFRQSIINRITDFIGRELSGALGDFLNELALSGFSGAVLVPSLGLGAPTSLTFDTRIDRIDIPGEHAVLAGSVRVDSRLSGARPSLGVPVVPGVLLDPEPSDQGSASIDITLANLVLYRLWYAGYFEDEALNLVSRFVNGFMGFEIDLQMPVAPVVVGREEGNGDVRLHVGPLLGRIRVPLLGDDPIGFRAAAQVDVGVRLTGNSELDFGPVAVSELMIALDEGQVTLIERENLDTLLEQVIQGVIDRSLNTSLPSLPIPSFTTPEFFAEFGIPEGTEVGVNCPQFDGTDRMWFASGEFGEIGSVECVDAPDPRPDPNPRPDPDPDPDPDPEPEDGQERLCEESCRSAGDGECDDGGPESEFNVCELGTDCADCGPRFCNDTCQWAGDGECDDGGPESDFNLCGLGTDCSDCGVR